MSEVDLPYPESWTCKSMMDLQDEKILRVEDGNHGEYRPRPNEFVENGEVFFIRSADLKNGRVDFHQASKINNEAYNRITKGKGMPGDILISHKGTVGTFGVIDVFEQRRFVCSPQTTFWRVIDHDALERDYLSVFMRSPHFMRQFMKYAGETDMAPYVSLTNQRKIKVLLPPMTIQKEIGKFIRYFDDLIEVNERKIKVLEEMARRFYREWFVDFRFPGHEKVKMVDSGHPDFGMIPEGWLSRFSDVVDFLEGPGLRNWQYREKGIPFLNIRTIGGNAVDLSNANFLDPDEVASKYNHFLLAEYDFVVSSSGTLGRLATITNSDLPLMLNTSIIRMRPKSERMGRWQLRQFLLSAYYQNQVANSATGTAQQNYGPMQLNQISAVSPPKVIADKYEELVGPMELLHLELIQLNRNLTKQRDLLLPKLISGEIDVSGLNVDDIANEAIKIALNTKAEAAQQAQARSNR